MEVIDFNIHLPPDGDVAKELDFTKFDPVASLNDIGPRLKEAGSTEANVMVLDPDILRRGARPLLSAIHDAGFKSTLMLDPRAPDAEDLVDEAARLGVSGIKFHSYFQNLAEHDYPSAIAVAQRASQRGLWVVVCCSYGTRRVYAVSGVRLVVALSSVIKTPMVALHAGGALVLDVMSIAFETPNLFLESSYSLPFWCGSSVETDFVFAMRKLGADRWLYGSDHPHIGLEDSRREIDAFFKRHCFKDREIRQILGETARSALW